MSKKHKHQQFTQSSSSGTTMSMSESHAAEYRIISRDLVRLLILNAVFLAAVLVVYYTNLRSHYLEHWFDRFV
jgi:hypothetical protein